MEGNSWRPAQGEPSAAEAAAGDWRSQLQHDARQRIVNKIMDTLKRHLPISVPEGLNELQKIAVRFEEKIYTAATSQSDYLRKISLKMLSMETKTQHTPPINPSIPNTTVPNQNPTDPVSLSNQGQSLAIPLVNQPAARQQLITQNLQNNTSAAVQSSANLPSALSSITGLSQSNISSVGQTSNLQNMPAMAQNSVSNSVGQGAAPDIYSNAQRPIQGRPHQQQIISQQQQPSQSQLIYQHQFQQQLLKQQKLQHPSLLQPQMQQQQQQQALLQPTQLQSSQQSLMQMSQGLQSGQSAIQQTQPTPMQSAAQPGLQQNQLNSIQQSVPTLLQQHPQSVARQQQQAQPSIHQQTPSLQQQPTSVLQQSNLTLQQQQPQLMGQQANISNMQQAQLLGQQNSVPDMQQQQQQQRLPVQQNSLLGIQQPQQMLSQQSISLHQQQQLGPQSNISGLQQQQQQQQQQQLLGSLPNVSNMQPHQRSMHILQHSKTVAQQQQQTQQTSLALLQSQGQQSQHQASQQQLMSPFQPQQAQLQQQLSMQQQPNSLQREMQQRLQASGALLQSQNAMEQQKQFIQAQRVLPEVSSSTSVDSTAQTGHAVTADMLEEIYQKIKSMKEMYYADLSELYQKIAFKLQQHEALIPPAKPSEHHDKMKSFKIMLERTLAVLQISKNNVQPGLKEKLPLYEKQIINILASNKKKVIPSQPQGQQQFQHPGGLAHSMPQQQQSQLTQLQQHDNHPNQVQQVNLQGSATSMQPAAVTGMQHVSMPLPTNFGVPTTQQNITNALHSGSNLDPVQGSSFNSLQQGAMGSMQHGGVGSVPNTINAPQQTNANTLSNSSMNTLQPNASLMQPSSNTLQQQHLKQQQQEQLLQSQQMKQQLQQRHVQQLLQQQQKQQLMQQQPSLQQQLHQQQKQQSAQMPAHQMQQLHQTNEANESKVRPALGIKPGLYQQHYSAGQRPGFYHQLKQGASFPISSPQNLQSSSPQISHNSSPQVDQHSLLPSQVKAGTPLQSANSPFVRSPSTPLAPSPIPADSEKQLSGISSLTNAAGHVGQQQSTVAPPQAQSLAVGTPGISASPFLAEYTSPDGNQANVPSVAPGKTSASERPLERLIKVVKSSTPKALSSAISDIGSVVSMIDRIAGSAPGIGSRSAVGDDLVAMTKCRLQARNFMSQDGSATTKKIKRNTSAMPLNNASSPGSVNDSFKQSYGLDTSELESTATSHVKRQKIEVNHALLEEIREINQQLIDTVVNISEEDADSIAVASDGEGTVIKCSFTAVALSPSLKSQFASSQMSPILPLKLLVPANYPKCSPILLDKLPDESSGESDDLSVKAKSRFSISLRGLSQPMSLGEMARTWDACARKVIAEYAQQTGGGSFSSRYGAWENCVGA